jgi:hypothetical protein
MYANLRGTRYRLTVKKLPDNIGGSCTSPDEPNPTIRICSTINEPEILLENLIHEMTHGMQWNLSEKMVTQFAEDMTAVLLKLGVKIDVEYAMKKLRNR